MPSESRPKVLLTCFLLSLYLLVYTGKIASYDGNAVLAVSSSFVRSGIPDIGVMGAANALEPSEMARMGAWGMDGALYSKKGVTPSVLLLPLVALAQVFPWLSTRATAMLLNPLVTIGTALALYSLVRQLAYRSWTAFFTALIYGSATMAVVYTKSLFGEPLAGLLLVLAVLGVMHRTRGYLALAGFALGLLLGVNMVYVAVVPVVALFIFWPRPKLPDFRDVLAFFIPIAVVLGGIGLYNWARFGNPLSTGYHFESGEGFTYPLLKGLYGLIASPHRGLFWYNPVLLLALPGWLVLWRVLRRLAMFIVVLSVLQIMLFAGWWSWHGGVVWGPRFLLPVIPLIALCLAPLIEDAWSHRWLWAVIGGFTVLSIGAQALGTLYNLFPYAGDLYLEYYDTSIAGYPDWVISNVGLSAIVGQFVLAVQGWPVEVAWLVDGLDTIHLISALAVTAAGIVFYFWRDIRWLLARQIGLVAVIILALNIVTARQTQHKVLQSILELNTALNPSANVLVASTLFDDKLVDLKLRTFSTNAPTEPDDQQAVAMWDYALGQGGGLWFVTWFPPHDPANWQERDLWERASFVRETVATGHRALLFNLHTAVVSQAGGWQFGDIMLEGYGVEQTTAGVWLAAEWRAETSLPEYYTWFIHLLDANGAILAQQDRAPGGGYQPTTAWIPGESVVDRLFFPGQYPEGVHFRIGWVNPTTGERLLVTVPDGSVLPDGFVLIDG